MTDPIITTSNPQVAEKLAAEARMPHTTRPVRLLSATTLTGTPIVTPGGEELGRVEEIMLDIQAGRISYAVLSFGGIMGLGSERLAIPWPALTVDTVGEKIILDVTRNQLDDAPSLDEDEWPEAADIAWVERLYDYYGYMWKD